MAWTSNLRTNVGKPSKASDVSLLYDNFDYQKARIQRKFALKTLQDVAAYNNIVAGTTTALSFAEIQYDEGPFHDEAHPKGFTIPTGCTYARFSYFYNASAANANLTIYVRKNGTSHVEGLPAKRLTQMKSDSNEGAIIQVSAGDYYEMVFTNMHASSTLNFSFSFYWFQIEGLFV